MRNLRIMTFGYDASVAHIWHSASQNSIHSHANNLLNELRSHRRDEMVRWQSYNYAAKLMCYVKYRGDTGL